MGGVRFFRGLWDGDFGCGRDVEGGWLRAVLLHVANGTVARFRTCAGARESGMAAHHGLRRRWWGHVKGHIGCVRRNFKVRPALNNARRALVLLLALNSRRMLELMLLMLLLGRSYLIFLIPRMILVEIRDFVKGAHDGAALE